MEDIHFKTMLDLLERMTATQQRSLEKAKTQRTKDYIHGKLDGIALGMRILEFHIEQTKKEKARCEPTEAANG